MREHAMIARAFLERLHEHRQNGHLELEEPVVGRAKPRLLAQEPARFLLAPRHVLFFLATHDAKLLLDERHARILVRQRLQEDVAKDVEHHALADGVLHEHLQRVVVVVRREQLDDPVRGQRLHVERAEDRGPSGVSLQRQDRLARARRAVEAGQIEDAIKEMAALPSQAAIMQWLDQARRYNEAHRALDVIEAAAILEPRTTAVAMTRVPAAPSPWTKRSASSTPKVGAKIAAKAQTR